MDRYQTVKVWVCFEGRLPKNLGSSSQFYEIQLRCWPREVQYVVKTSTIRKRELNTFDNFLNLRTENLFVDRCENTIKVVRKM